MSSIKIMTGISSLSSLSTRWRDTQEEHSEIIPVCFLNAAYLLKATAMSFSTRDISNYSFLLFVIFDY